MSTVALCNQIRGLLTEFGFVLPVGPINYSRKSP